MSGVAIRVEGLGKRYRIGARQAPQTLRWRLAGLGRRMDRPGNGKPRQKYFWALSEISFEVAAGETLAVIGKNGAGKSTLLKILSRITEPTTGEAMIYGRVGSLLEVGTGFHPELSGRENVFLNGAILGMRQAEIRDKFDEIVAFAGVETFIDTPVKRYSTGMQVRLAFAVAAHLETEILLVDEVLAVGDAEFQERCLGKMEEVAHQGRTVVLVSHTMPAVQALCERTILIAEGRLAADGPTAEIVERYLMGSPGDDSESAVRDLTQKQRSAGRGQVILEAWVENGRSEITDRISMGEPLTICVRYRLHRELKNPGFGFGLETADGLRILSLNNYMTSRRPLAPPVEGVCRCRFPDPRLVAGKFWISLSVVEDQNEWVDYVERALAVTVVAADVFGTGKVAMKTQGVVWSPGEIDVDG